MNDIQPFNGGNIIDIIHQPNGLDNVKPFQKDIYLFSTHIAGTSHIENILELEPQIVENLKVNFFREPNNKYDSKAIVIKDSNKNKLGYVPRDKNEIISRLMDSGKIIFGKVVKKELKGNYLDIKIDVFFKD